MAIFKKPAKDELPLIVAMAGVRMGDRVACVPGRDVEPLVQVAARAGLSGRVVALVAPDRIAAVDGAALQQGVLVETAALQPSHSLEGPFDLSVVDERDPDMLGMDARGIAAIVAPLLRPGGRLVMLARGTPTGLRALTGGRPADPDPLLEALRSAGFGACRTVGDRDGVLFLEGVRA